VKDDATRRVVLKALAALPALLLVPRAHAREYQGPQEALDAIDALAGGVDARLLALAEALPSSRSLVASLRADLAQHAEDRARFRERNGWGAPAAVARSPVAGPRSLARLREQIQDLAHAHAEGLPALGEAEVVQRLAEHMVDVSRHLTVIDLWIEGEGGE
jgi:hypothetical protein